MSQELGDRGARKVLVMCDEIAMIPTKYQVNFSRGSTWEPVGGRLNPQMYYTLERARAAEEKVSKQPGVVSTMVLLVEQAPFTSLYDGNVYLMTTYTGLM